ncbi:MAG: peptide chain release factor 2 [Rhodobacteraceae bacterium]|nr:peptide chain release factor 2 [Paracoccaceae bacterium]
MRAEIQDNIDAVRKSLHLLHQRQNGLRVQDRLRELDTIVEEPDFWLDAQKASTIMKERQALSVMLDSTAEIEMALKDTVELIELAEEESDQEIINEAAATLDALRVRARKQEIEALLGDEADGNDAILEIKAGAGGLEACDWAAMLVRMYERWARQHGYRVELIAQNRDSDAGLKSYTGRIIGRNAYGWLKSESGVHRLVRNSPFDSSDRRHTTFGSVGVYPVVDETIEIEINPADLRVDTFRASGAGGQHVNKTDSAVRMTHIPTGIVVSSSEKSQHMNRSNCMLALKSRLYDLELRKRMAKVQELHDQRGDAGWGNQIRSYVLTPFKLVKDLRTNLSTPDADSVLEGNLDEFMAATLAMNLAGKSRADAVQESAGAESA